MERRRLPRSAVDSYVDVALVHRCRRSSLPQRRAGSRPIHFERATRQLDGDALAELAPTPADGDGGGGAGTARQRLADAALVDAEANAALVDALHETDVDAPRKAWMALKRGAQALDGRRRDRRHGDHGMRVAHRDGAELDGLAGDLDAIAIALPVGEERQRARAKVRHAEVDADVVGRAHAGRDGAGRAHERELVPQTWREEPGEAAHAVAALLDLAAVRVEIAVARVGAVRALARDEQQLIEPDASAPVRPMPDQLGIGRRSPQWPFDDHE